MATDELGRTRGGYKNSICPETGNVISDHLYFMLAGDTFVKIGRTNDVSKRLAWVQNGCPLEVTLIGSIPNEGWMESIWHSAFKASRVRGEWYATTEALQSSVQCALEGGDWLQFHEPRRAYLEAKAKKLRAKFDYSLWVQGIEKSPTQTLAKAPNGKTDNAEIIRELTRAKVAFQLRAIKAVLGEVG